MQITDYTGIFTTHANDIWFKIYNANIPAGIGPGLSQSGYKFLAQVIDLDKLTSEDRQYLGDYTFVPDKNGNAWFSINKIVDAVISNSQLDIGNLYQSLGLLPNYYDNIMDPDIPGYCKYNLRLGNVWNPQLQFNYNFDYSGNTGLSFSTPHYLLANDEIIINTYDPTTLIGQKVNTTVVSVIDDYAIEINEPYSLGNIAVGTIIFAKQWLTSLPNPYYAWNGAIDYGQENQVGGSFGGWADDNLVIRFNPADFSTSGQFLTPFGLTNSQEAKKVLIDDVETLTFLLPHRWYASDNGNDYYTNFNYVVTTYDNNWITQSSTSYSLNFTEINSLDEISGYNKFTIGSGPVNILQNMPSALPTNYYSVDLQFIQNYLGFTFSCSTGPYYYQIDTTCSPFNNVRLIWTNRLGGYDCFNFRLNSQRNESIRRKEYKSILKPLYTTGDRGDTTITVDTDEIWTINTDWITEQEYLALNDLITSIDVFVVEYSDAEPAVYPIIIVDNSYTQKTQLTEKLFNMTVKYKLAYEKYIQYR
jgi:hypothetical protein